MLPFSDWRIEPEEIEIDRRPDGSLWRLGGGGFGDVYKATRGGVTTVAAKIMSSTVSDGSASTARTQARLDAFSREVAILKSCRDRNIVLFIGACLDEGRTMLVTEYLPGGDLFQAIARDTLASEEASAHRRFGFYRTPATTNGAARRANGLGMRIAIDIARGLAYLHSRKIIHMDMKSANILLARDMTAKIADVGLARILKREYLTTLQGSAFTFAYAAPEVLLGRECSTAVDCYGLGIIYWELATGQSPDGRRLRRIETAEAPEGVTVLIQRCLSEDPALRPTAVECVQALTRLAEA